MNKQELEKLKETHGDIWKVEVEGREAYFKKPTRQVLKIAGKLGTNDPYRFNEVLVKNCFVAGDERLKDANNVDAVADQLAELIPHKSASIKKC